MPRDKVLHFIAGIVIAMIGSLLSGQIWIGVGLSVVAGIVKEAYDNFNRDRHTPEMMDMVVTWAGGFLVGFVLKIWEGL